MFSSLIEVFLKDVNAKSITEIFLWMLVSIFIFALISKKMGRMKAFTLYTPTLLTSLGILGTFVGIIIGLLDFDVVNIKESIGPLLNGLKTAFITSVFGMLFSIAFKIINATGWIDNKNEDGVVTDEVGVLELYGVMKEQVEGIKELNKAISGGDESSLIGQVKILRSDFGDYQKSSDRNQVLSNKILKALYDTSQQQQESFKAFQDRLWIKLQDFADMLAKSATEQVIEALKQVIQDFNNNLIEQFGENFKQLNQAVFELVNWQENYKNQLADMREQYDHGVKAITETESAVSNISQEAKIIPETMMSLQSVMEVNQNQITELDRHLVAFSEVRDRAVEAVPEIRSQIDQAIEGARLANDKLAEGIVESTEKISTVVSEGAEQYRDTVDRTRAALTESAQATADSTSEIKEQFSSTLIDINSHMRDLVSEITEGGKAIGDSYREAGGSLLEETKTVSQSFSLSMSELSESLKNTIEEQAYEHRKQADNIFAGLEKSIEDALSQTGESVQKQVVMIDETMGVEIEKVMQSMGQALASISGKFTDDYSRLVLRMSEIVNTHRAN